MIVDEGRILAVESPSEVSVELDVTDLGDATLLPGLIDAHTHLTWNAQQDAVARVTEDDHDSLREQAQHAAAAALAVGITTVRDLGDRAYIALELRDRFRADPSAGPEIVASGPPITVRLGHCGFLGGEAETPDELAAAVAERAERGVDVIKVMATGGNMTPTSRPPEESQYNRDQLHLLAETAHAAGLPITAHAHGAVGAMDAVSVGFDAIEHAGFWTATGAEVPSGAVEALLARGTFIVATPARLDVDISTAPAAILARLSQIREVLNMLHTAGVAVAYASDAGIGPAKPHDVLPYSLGGAVAAGWSTTDALRAMTSVAASASGLGGRKGQIAPGFDADLLAVSGNPVDCAQDLSKTLAVYRAGTRVGP